jgi:hypothetical protein
VIQRLGDHHGFFPNESRRASLMMSLASFSVISTMGRIAFKLLAFEVVKIPTKCSSVKENWKHAQCPAEEGFLVHSIFQVPYTGIWVIWTRIFFVLACTQGSLLICTLYTKLFF